MNAPQVLALCCLPAGALAALLWAACALFGRLAPDEQPIISHEALQRHVERAERRNGGHL